MEERDSEKQDVGGGGMSSRVTVTGSLQLAKVVDGADECPSCHAPHKYIDGDGVEVENRILITEDGHGCCEECWGK